MSRTRILLKTAALAGGALAVWELRTRTLAALRARTGVDYWKTYYDSQTIQRAEEVRREAELPTTGADLHIDLYPRAEADAPVLIFNHGVGGYGRLFVHLAMAFYDLGYTVILPDQRGQGLSGGPRGDFPAPMVVQDIVAVTQWARTRYGGPLYMLGVSLGGSYTYYAAQAGAPVEAIACLNLFDLGSPLDALGMSRLNALTRLPYLPEALALPLRALAAPLGGLHMPLSAVAYVEHMMDERDYVFHAQWAADPLPPQAVTLRTISSWFSSPPQVPFEFNRVPTLVLNQSLDRMVEPDITRRNFERLGGPKRLVELPYGHWSSQDNFLSTLLSACNEWFKRTE